MRRLALAVLIVTAIVACNTDDNTCATCVGGGKTNPPDVYGGGCDASKTPAEGGCDVNDSGGVFVDAKGSGDGSKAAPFKTIQQGIDAAKSGKKNVFVCEGTYDQALVLTGSPTDGVVLHGGFACGTWAHAGNKVVITSTKGGVVLRSDGVAVAVEDIELDAVDGKNPGDSSIVALSNGASAMTFRRSTLSAGRGVSGATGSTDATDPGTAPAGNDGLNNAPTSPKVCQCGSLTTTGGAGASMLGNSVAGGGLPIIPNAPLMSGGPGMSTMPCNMGGDGRDGASAPDAPPATPAKVLGLLSANGWQPGKGDDGVEGTLSQGGGGGAFYISGSLEWQAGGGGCGGCGGHKGGGGGGGGGSIGVIAINSLVRLQATTVSTLDGGGGGLGGAGQKGQQGGPGGKSSPLSYMMGGCSGGRGGAGARGGDGGGGPGGISVGVAWAGTAPDLAGGTITVGAPGKGANGAIDGVAVKDRAF